MKFDRPYFSNKARSIKSEKRAAEQLGGKVQPASGALPVVSMKADVKTPEFLVDVKLTNKSIYTVNFNSWAKLFKEAWANKKRPMYMIKSPNCELIMIDLDTFNELTRKHQ